MMFSAIVCPYLEIRLQLDTRELVIVFFPQIEFSVPDFLDNI